ncbi:hypothetical protein VNO77_03796 [Canavalia gladiata]|uniref:Uncharacterized protein n=1 Tax=Canavalia gladiata TaxID=3824 RepID=A0AAN9N1T4_CANGL
MLGLEAYLQMAGVKSGASEQGNLVSKAKTSPYLQSYGRRKRRLVNSVHLILNGAFSVHSHCRAVVWDRFHRLPNSFAVLPIIVLALDQEESVTHSNSYGMWMEFMGLI